MSRTILAARVAGIVAPTITVAPVLSWTIGVGTSPSVTAPTYTGSPGTITYTLKRDGVNVAGVVDVSEATLEAYVTDTSADGACDIGPSMTVVATVTNAAGSDSDTSNAEVYDDAARLPETAIGVSTAGLTLADGDTTVDDWAATLGGISTSPDAPASTNRPAYSATGGTGSRPLVTFDGTDNVLDDAITKGSAWADYEYGIVGSRVAFGTAGDRWLAYMSSATTLRFGLADNNALTFRNSISGGVNLTSASDPDGVVAHYSGDAASGGTVNVRVGGAVDATTSSTVTSRADGDQIRLGGNGDGTNAGNIAIQAWYMGPLLTADQRTELRALLSYHTGVSC